MHEYDVFLSYNEADRVAVEEIARRLVDEAGLQPFLDKWHLVPGEPWQEAREDALDQSLTCAVFVGPSGISPWENEEMRAAIQNRVLGQEFRVIPILLPGAERGERGRLPAFLTRTTWVEFRESIDDAEAFRHLVAGITGKAPGPSLEEPVYEGVCPYRGLQVFDVVHAAFFFGREADTQWLISYLRHSRFLAVVGPSGSGKSSLVRAGLIAALRRGDLPRSDEWPIGILSPGHHPLESLAAVLLQLSNTDDDLTALPRLMQALGSNRRLLHLATRQILVGAPDESRIAIVVDQFEEIFTFCEDELQRRAFIENLLYASAVEGGRTVVVLAMRADYYGICSIYPDLAARITDNQMLVSSMKESELRRAIEHPAQLVGLEFEGGLVDLLLRDVTAESGALPLLQHTLLELWERRRGRRLAHNAYREIGGIQGAIAHRAESIYAQFNSVQRDITRRVLLRLIQPSEGTGFARRRVWLVELLPVDGQSDEVLEVVQKLADARLLTTDRDEVGNETVDVSHEALIQGWPRLRNWVEEDQSAARTQRQVTHAAREWISQGTDSSFLYRGRRLDDAIEWIQNYPDDVNPLEYEFVGASERQRRRGQRLRRLGLSAALVVAMILVVTFRIQANLAAEAERASRAREIAAIAQNQLDMNAERSLLLTLESINLLYMPQTENLLRQALDAPRAWVILVENFGSPNGIAWSPDGRYLAAGSGNTIIFWDAQTWEVLSTTKTSDPDSCIPCETIMALEWSPNGRYLAIAILNGVVQVWDMEQGVALCMPTEPAGSVRYISWNPTGTALVVFSASSQDVV